MILLGINCGYGNTDLATKTRSYLDLEGGWAFYPRPKTNVSRTAKLWPETVTAIKAALDVRPEPGDPNDAELIFVTPEGQRSARTVLENRLGGGVHVVNRSTVNMRFRTTHPAPLSNVGQFAEVFAVLVVAVLALSNTSPPAGHQRSTRG